MPGAGSATGAGAAPVSVAPKTSGKSSKKGLIIGLICGGVVAIVAAVLVWFLFFSGRSIEDTVDEYLDACFNTDGEAIVELMHESYIDAMLDKKDMTKKELVENFSDRWSRNMENLEDEYGDYKGYSFEIVDEEYLSEDEDELEEIQEYWEDKFDIKIDDAVKVEVEITIEFEDDEYELSPSFTLMKVGNTWYYYEE